MADPFENYSTVLRMRQSRFEREDAEHSVENNKLVVESKPSIVSESMIPYENVDNYPAILRIREVREPMNSLTNCQSCDPPIVKDNTMVSGCRQRVEARTPYYTESNSETQSETEESETTESESSTDSGTASSVESLPVLMVPPGRTQPNLMIPSAMSLEDEKKPKFVVEDPIQEIVITESNILESFSMQSLSRRSRESRDTFDDDEDEERGTCATRSGEDTMDMVSISPHVEEMKQIMLAFWKQNQSSATILFSISWQLSRRYQSIGAFPAHPNTNIDGRETELQLPPIPLDDLLLWRLFQRFFANHGEIVIPQHLCPSAFEEFQTFDEIEGMESDELSDSYLVMDGILTADQVMSLEDFDDDEIFKFRNCNSYEHRMEQGHSEDEPPSLSEDDDIFKFRGCIEENPYTFESEPPMADSNLASSQILTPYEPFSKLEKIIEEVNSNDGETESSATSNEEDTLFQIEGDIDHVDEANGKALEDDTRSNEFKSEDSLDDIIMINTKSGVHDGGISVDESGSHLETLQYSQEDTENSGDWGNAYCNSIRSSKLEYKQIEDAFDMAVRGIRSIETDNTSARSRRSVWEGSIRSRDCYSVVSEQSNFPEDCLPENLVDRFLDSLEIALCLR